MLTAADEFLTAADLIGLTGKTRGKDQCAELERKGIPYILGAHNRPQVSRHHTRMIATGQPVVQSKGPVWSAVK